jgi:hypothetical protein
MIEKTREQEANALFFIEGLKGVNRAYVRQAKLDVRKLAARAVEDAQRMKPRTTQCAVSPFCVRQQSDVDVVQDYHQTVTEIYKRSVQILSRPASTGGNCRGSVAACIKRSRAAATKRRSLTELARRLFNQNRALVKQLPMGFDVCS